MLPALCWKRRGMMSVVSLPVADAGRCTRPGTSIVSSAGTQRRSRLWTTGQPRPDLSASTVVMSCARPLFGTGHSNPVLHRPALSDEHRRVRYSLGEPSLFADLKVPADKLALQSSIQIPPLPSKQLPCRDRLSNWNPVPKSQFVGRDARQSGT